MMNAYASSSDVTLDDLPPTSFLQSWVHRPQAVAACSVKDVYSLCNVSEDNGSVAHTTRDLYLLGQFPCRFVEIVAWVAGVENKDATMTVWVDDGDGEHILPVIIRLAERSRPKSESSDPPMAKTNVFRTAAERSAMRSGETGLPKMISKLYARPDVCVGDTVRIIGRVDDWRRRTETIRQLHVDEASGTGSIRVVDPDEAYTHVVRVAHLHETLYTQPFRMPAMPSSSAPTPSGSPARSNTSMLSSIGMSSELDDEDDDYGRDLPDPSKLSSSRLTEATFKLYLIDNMVCNVTRIMKAAMRSSNEYPISTLAALFPEYTGATMQIVEEPQPLQDLPSIPSSEDNAQIATPRPSGVFPSRAERERDRIERERKAAAPPTPTPIHDSNRTPRVHRSVKLVKVWPPRVDPSVHLPQIVTPSVILENEKLRDLAERVVNQHARNEEKYRRRRAKEGTSTDRDRQIVATRRARGIPSGDYHLTPADRELKMTRLVEWAIRQAAGEGSIVHLSTADAAGGLVSGYVAIPPELLGPLLVPLVQAKQQQWQKVFRPRSERGKSNVIQASSIASRLREWGEDGRWERVGEWAVEQALAWAEEKGLVRLRM